MLAALAAAEAAGSRHLRRARAGHHRVPARGPAPEAGVRGRQRGRAREGRRRHRPVRHGRRVRGRRTRGRQGLANAAAVCAGGRVVGVYRKRFLPNYGVFDEQRWFVPGAEHAHPLRRGRGLGRRLGLRGRLVRRRPGGAAGPGRAPTSWSTSTRRPTTGAGAHERLAMLGGRVAEAGCAIAYVNQVGGQDELVFDGDSLVVGGRRDPAGHRRPVRRRTSSWSTSPLGAHRPRRRHRAAARGSSVTGRAPAATAAGPARRPALRPRSATTPRCTPRWCSAPATTWARTGSPRP